MPAAVERKTTTTPLEPNQAAKEEGSLFRMWLKDVLNRGGCQLVTLKQVSLQRLALLLVVLRLLSLCSLDSHGKGRGAAQRALPPGALPPALRRWDQSGPLWSQWSC